MIWSKVFRACISAMFAFGKSASERVIECFAQMVFSGIEAYNRSWIKASTRCVNQYDDFA